MFKEQYKFSDRLFECKRIIQKYPDRIPVVLEKSRQDNLQEYKLAADMTIGQFLYTIRKRMILPAEKSIFIFINDKLNPCSSTIGSIYNQESDEDGFLYMLLQGENTFGYLIASNLIILLAGKYLESSAQFVLYDLFYDLN